ncbi:MAG: OmpA family protein [Owenweeksia sp.]
MKRIALLAITSLFAMSLTTSCVSKKKYVKAQSKIDRLQQDSTAFENKIAGLKTDLERTSSQFSKYKEMSEDQKTAMMSQLEKQGSELSEKDQALQLRAQRLRALQDRLNRQQEIVNNLRQTVADALVNFDAEELSVEVKNGKVYVSLSDKLLFPSGSAKLNKEGKDAIGKVAEVLQKNPRINIEVVGHTDDVPINTAKYGDNWELSTARATTITRLLTDDYTIPGERLTASGMSKYNPVATNETKEGRSRNRRTEIVLTPKLEELFKILSGDAESATSTDQ